MNALKSTAVLLLLASAVWSQTTRQAMHLNAAQLQKLAEKGDPEAQCEIGRRHLLGIGSKPDTSEAASWFGKAASAGSGEALFELFLMSRDGIGMAQDKGKAEKLLAESLETGNARAHIEMADRQTQAAASPGTKEAVEALLKLARQGDPWAQLALGRAIARGATSLEGSDAMQWLLKASTAEDPRIPLVVAGVFRDGEGLIRADSQRAAMLYRKLSEREVRAAHGELAKLAPESFRGVCKEQTIERVSRDNRLTGAAVRVEGRLTHAGSKEWSLGNDKRASVRVLPEVSAPSTATTGRFLRIWGVVETPGVVRALLAEVPEPKVEAKFELTEPRIVKGTAREKYVVNGLVRNTGKQLVSSLKLTIRVYQPESGKEDSEVLTITDLGLNEQRPFTAAFRIEDVKAADNQLAPVRAEVKVGDLEW